MIDHPVTGLVHLVLAKSKLSQEPTVEGLTLEINDSGTVAVDESVEEVATELEDDVDVAGSVFVGNDIVRVLGAVKEKFLMVQDNQDMRHRCPKSACR